METGTKSIMTSSVVALIGTIVLLCFFSCGKRTTSIDRIEIKKDSIKIENNLELKQNITWSDIGTVRPLDASKPMLWNGTWYYNAVLKFDKSIKKGIDIKSNENLSYTGSEQISKTKNIEKTDYSNVWVGISLVIGTIFVLYLTLKKYIP